MTTSINKILKIKNTYDAPIRLMEILRNRTEREKVFKKMLELFNHKLDFDWFNEYFQKSFTDQKDGQVFTPTHTADLLSELSLGIKGHSLDPCAGTGALIISDWNRIHQKKDYKPSDYVYICIELSDNMIPFLIFNLAVRGITAIVIHGDMITRESKGAFLILNEQDKPENFSIINSLPYFKATEEMLGFKFTVEKYPHQFEF